MISVTGCEGSSRPWEIRQPVTADVMLLETEKAICGDLQSVDYRYSQAYPAERELLGIGAVDPDAVMMVSRLTKGKAQPSITEVLIRDPMNPSTVLYFKGPVDGLEDNLSAGWALLLEDEAKLAAAFKKHRVTPPTPPTIPPDSTLEVAPGKPIKVRTDGRERKAEKTYALDYDAPVFPPLPQQD